MGSHRSGRSTHTHFSLTEAHQLTCASEQNGGHCQPLLCEHPRDPSIGRFELANFDALESLIRERDIDCEFVRQPGVRALYDRRSVDEIEEALFTLQQTAPDLVKYMRLVTDHYELEKLRVPGAAGAVVTSKAARLWPYKLITRVLEDLVTSTDLKGSFNLQTLTPVESLTPSDGHRWAVETPRGTIIASKVVLATNGYTSHLLNSFTDLIVPCRGQMSALLPLPSVAGDNRLKTSFGFHGETLGDYLIQRPNDQGGHLMFGGGRQVKLIYTTDDTTIDEDTARYLRSRLFETMGLPEGKAVKNTRIGATNTELTATHEWTGIMGFSRDELPWVGEVPDTRNLYVSAGYTGHGMVNAWLCGKAVARMASSSADSRSSEVGVPTSYLVTKARILKAQELRSVQDRDGAEVEAWKTSRAAAHRPLSGYA